MNHTFNISQGCQPERICMTNFTYRHSTPHWEQEVSHLVKLNCHFHKLVELYAVLTATTRFFPDGRGGARARSTPLAALIIIFILTNIQTPIWPLSQTRKRFKLCTKISRGKKFYILLFSQVGGAKRLHSAP